jgi:predicted AAA+ superfamily ATPase
VIFFSRIVKKTVDAVQVTFSMKHHAVRKREIEGLVEALKAFDLPRGIILTYDEFDSIDVDGRTIEVQPAWYWMLVR